MFNLAISSVLAWIPPQKVIGYTITWLIGCCSLPQYYYKSCCNLKIYFGNHHSPKYYVKSPWDPAESVHYLREGGAGNLCSAAESYILLSSKLLTPLFSPTKVTPPFLLEKVTFPLPSNTKVMQHIFVNHIFDTSYGRLRKYKKMKMVINQIHFICVIIITFSAIKFIRNLLFLNFCTTKQWQINK